MNTALNVAAWLAAHLVPALAVKYAIDHERPGADLRHEASVLLALVLALAHFRSHR